MSQYNQKLQEALDFREADIIDVITKVIRSQCKTQGEVIGSTARESGYSLTAVENVLKANTDILWKFKLGTGNQSRARIYFIIQ